MLYCVGNSVVNRSTKDWTDAYLYQEHQVETTVARYAPSGFYIASCDKAGKCRIWDTVNDEHILKNEYPIIAGPILDLQWDGESKRIIAVGDGRGKYGRAFLADTGSSVGEISGHSKTVTSCAIKQARPYRCATGSEDLKVNWYEGPPFKYKKSIKGHTRWINCLRFSPDGSKLVTVGSDKLGFFYDGKTGEEVGKLPKDCHKGGIMCVDWSDDSKKILTVSADKTAKVWNAGDYSLETTFTFPNDVAYQQLGCLWQGDQLITVSLSGKITVLDPSNPSTPARVQLGHNRFITTVDVSSSGKVYTGDYEGNVIEWDLSNASTQGFKGTKHKNQIQRIVVSGDTLVTTAMDDSVKFTSLGDKNWGTSVSTGSLPHDLAVKGDTAIVACIDCIVVVQGGKVASKTDTKFKAMSVAVSNSGKVAVGGDDNKVHLYTLSGTNLTPGSELTKHRSAVTTVAWSPSGDLLASGDSGREIIVWEGDKPKVTGWVFHTARVTCLAWSPSGKHVASTSLDGDLYIWNVNEPDKRISTKNAHKGGSNGVAWVNDNQLVSVGQDCALKSWDVKY